MSRTHSRLVGVAAVLFALGLVPDGLGPGRAAFGGMPATSIYDLEKVVVYTEHAEWRLQGISFFLAGVLLSALVFRLIWNHLAKDFTFLPKMSYVSALATLLLWGMLFVLVLTMISGARELMTPGAWKRRGATYELRNDEQTPTPSPTEKSRAEEPKAEGAGQP